MRTFDFPSKSSPDAKPHRTERHSDGSVSCTCLGFRHPKQCWHAREVKKMYPLSDDRWAEALMLIRSGAHNMLLELIKVYYPVITRDEMPTLIHTLCEWVCPLCNSIGEAPRDAGCTGCHDEG